MNVAKVTLLEDRRTWDDWVGRLGVSLPDMESFALPVSFWIVQYVSLVELRSLF